MKFKDMGLDENILEALDYMGFDEATPIQEQAIPAALSGRDLIACAQTGTGKTAAYLLPILSLLDDGGFPKDATNCVIMSPTRELAQQIDQAMQGFSYYMDDVSSVAVYGGNDGSRYDQEFRSMKMGADLIIATPGRLISHITMGNVDFSKVSFFVLDEADRMLDMGFAEDILSIAKLLPDTCQNIMFSATMPAKIEELAKTILKNPSIIKLAVSKPADKIKQLACVCHENQKEGVLRHIFEQYGHKRVIVFSSSKIKVKDINRSIRGMKINSGEMHSDLTQSQRDEVMYQFKSGKIDVLVATDIVSRGIDIDDISMVINYDVPRDAEDYVHRIGRTARADNDGVAITLIRGKEVGYFMRIERFLEREVEKIPMPQHLGKAPEYKESKADHRRKKSGGKRRDGRNRPKGNRKQKGAENKQADAERQNKDAGQQKKKAENKQAGKRRKSNKKKTAAAKPKTADNNTQA